MEFNDQKIFSKSLKSISNESLRSRGRRSSADGLRESIFQAIFDPKLDRRLETNIGIEFAAPIHDPLNAEFAIPATHSDDIISTANPSSSETEVSRSTRKKLRRSVSFDQALTIYSLSPPNIASLTSLKEDNVEKLVDKDKEGPNQPSTCPNEAEIAAEVASISSKEPESIPLSTYTQLLASCAKGDIEKVNEITEKYPSSVKYAYKKCYGYTPLHIAVKSGSVKLVQLLMKKGANMNAKSSLWYTPLHIAAISNKIEIVEYLLSKGADQEIMDVAGRTFIDHLSAEAKDLLHYSKYKKIIRVPSVASISSTSQTSDFSFLSTSSKDPFGSIRMGSIRKGIKGIMNISANLTGYGRKKNTSLENLNRDYGSYNAYANF